MIPTEVLRYASQQFEQSDNPAAELPAIFERIRDRNPFSAKQLTYEKLQDIFADWYSQRAETVMIRMDQVDKLDEKTLFHPLPQFTPDAFEAQINDLTGESAVVAEPEVAEEIEPVMPAESTATVKPLETPTAESEAGTMLMPRFEISEHDGGQAPESALLANAPAAESPDPMPTPVAEYKHAIVQEYTHAVVTPPAPATGPGTTSRRVQAIGARPESRMAHVSDYMIVRADLLEDLVASVKDFIAENWSPMGGLVYVPASSTTSAGYLQTMVRYS